MYKFAEGGQVSSETVLSMGEREFSVLSFFFFFFFPYPPISLSRDCCGKKRGGGTEVPPEPLKALLPRMLTGRNGY